MANEPFITRKDLEEVTQKVAIQNSKDIAKPLVDQQKKNDLKELEKSIEQKALFQDIADGIRGLGDSLLKGLRDLIPKTDGGLSKLLGLGLGLLLAPFVAFVDFLGQLGIELNFFTKGKAGAWLKDVKLRFKNFFVDIFDKLKKSKLGKFITGIVDKLKNSKLFKSISSLFQKVFGAGKGFFSRLSGIFKSIVKFATGGPFKAIMKFAGAIGRILGKVFLPITILMSIFDFVKGFMRGYEEDGIIGGIKEGFNDLFDGLVGGLLRVLMWIPTKIAEWLGLDKVSKEIGKQTEKMISAVKKAFGGIVDLLVGIFTWDTQKMKEGLTAIWESIVDLVMAPFSLIGSFIEDIFDIDLDELFAPITDAFENINKWFNDMGNKLSEFFSMETAKKFFNKLNPFSDDDEGADATKIFNEQMRKSKPLLQDIPAGGFPGGGSQMASVGDTSVTNSSPTIINNIFNAPSNNGIAAMQRAFMS